MTDNLVLISVAAPTVFAEATHAVAATGYEAIDTLDPREITRYWTRAAAVLIDAEAASHAATLAKREQVFFLAADPGPVDWRKALNVHAEAAILVPSGSRELLAAMGHSNSHSHGHGQSRASRMGERGVESAVVAIVSAGGGSGASSVAAAVALTASANPGGEVTLIDAADYSGGLDLLVGLEDAPGLRWPDVPVGEPLDAASLRASLPATRGGVAVLSAARSTIADPFRLTSEGLAEVITACPGLVVIDCQPGSPALTTADLAVVVCAAQVRPAAAATSLVAELRAQRVPVAVVVRHRDWSGLSAADVEKLTGADVIAELGHSARIPKAAELTGFGADLPKPLATVARAILEVAGWQR